jgi:hypothetical protein
MPDRVRQKPVLAAVLPLLGLVIGLGVACAGTGRGVAPDREQIYFPVGLALDAQAEFLVVVGSDFDLQFNQGTVQSLSVARIRELTRIPCADDAECPQSQHCDLVPTTENRSVPSHFCVDDAGLAAGLPCGVVGETTPWAKVTVPGRCAPVSLADPPDGGVPLLRDAVGISAFATGAVLRTDPTDTTGSRSRLFIPVRGDSTLHWAELEDGMLQCGQEGTPSSAGAPSSCEDEYKVSLAPGWIQDIQPVPEDDDPVQTVDPLEVAPEPYDVAATADGRVLVMTHQLNGRVSTFANDWIGPPVLVDRQTLDTSLPMGVAAVPPVSASELWPSFAPTFLIGARSEARVQLLAFLGDGILGNAALEPTAPVPLDETSRPSLEVIGSTAIRVNASGFDSRGVAVDDEQRRTALSACDPSDIDCLQAAAAIPLDLYVANRSPNSLLVGTIEARVGPLGNDGLPNFHDTIPLTSGPSRAILGWVRTRSGQRERRVFVTCFDSALIYVYDPARRAVESEIPTGRGPHAIAFDPIEPVAYVGHFTDSYVGVVSLDQTHPQTYGTMLASIGLPVPPRAAK